jgi:hypothetical protein
MDVLMAEMLWKLILVFFSFFNFLKDVENYEMGANALEIYFFIFSIR